jgi:LysR family glycine cleavage system transcriptional activator
MSNLPSLASVRVFEASGRCENFTRAAAELGMSQAAVSYHIKQLERHLGQEMFIRVKGRVRLSDSGRKLHAAVHDAFAQMSAAFGAVRDDESAILSLTASSSFGSTWLSSRIGMFQLRYPDLAVRLSVADELLMLGEAAFDAGIRSGAGNWPGLRSDFLFRAHATPMCTPEFLEHNRIETPADLLRVERLAPNDPWWSGWFAAAGIEADTDRRTGLEFDNQLQDARAVLGGFGVALMTPMFWSNELSSGRLVQPFDIFYGPGAAYWLIHPVERHGVRKIERFREWIHEELATLRQNGPAAIWKMP